MNPKFRRIRRLTVGFTLIASIIVVLEWLNVEHALSFFKQDVTYCISLKGEYTCHSTNHNPYRHYGPWTAYITAMPNTTDDSFHFKGCVPKLFYLLSRHATRYPERRYIHRMIDTLPELRQKIIEASDEGKSNMCQMDIQKLVEWDLPLVLNDSNKLSETGELEAIGLALRYKRRFPQILDRDFSPENFVFQYTSKERALASAEAFAAALFGKNVSIAFLGEPYDRVMHFHKNCRKLQKHCKDSRLDMSEMESFESGPFRTGLLNSISQRIGFEVTYGDVEIMYKMCIYAYTLGFDDIWCSVFSYDELKVMEYQADMDDYYKHGYGNRLNYEEACRVVQHLVHLFRTNLPTNGEKAVLQFSNSRIVKKVYPRLGLFHDAIPLKADNFCSHNNRKWKTSIINPFNSNIAIVLYDCDGGEHKIAAFHNEKPVVLGGCDSELCPLQDFFSTYGSISQNCSIKHICCACCIPFLF